MYKSVYKEVEVDVDLGNIDTQDQDKLYDGFMGSRKVVAVWIYCGLFLYSCGNRVTQSVCRVQAGT